MTELEPSDAERIKKSFIWILPKREEFSTALYRRLFTVAPEARSLFSSDMDQQREKLIATLAFVVNNADNLEDLSGEVRALGRRHVDYGVELAHYDILKGVLVDTLEEFIGDAFDAKTQAAWGNLFDRIADAMTSAGAAGSR